MPIRVVTTFDEHVSPPRFYRHLERLPKRKRAEFVRRTSWSGFDRDQDDGQRASHGEVSTDKGPSGGLRIDHDLEEEIRAVCLNEKD